MLSLVLVALSIDNVEWRLLLNSSRTQEKKDDVIPETEREPRKTSLQSETRLHASCFSLAHDTTEGVISRFEHGSRAQEGER
jgi:hypothetical protein